MSAPHQTLILDGIAALPLDAEGRLLDDERDDLYEAARKYRWLGQFQDVLCGADERRASELLRQVAARVEIALGAVRR